MSRQVLFPVIAIAAELLGLGCMARHVGIPGCSAVQAVVPGKCEANSYLRIIGKEVEVVCVVNGKEQVTHVRCAIPSKAEDK